MQRKRVFWSSWILNECNLSCKIVKSCRIISVLFSGKIYRLKQHFLPPAIAWRLTKIKKKCLFVCCFFFKLWPSPILTRKWMNIWKSTKVYTIFFFFWWVTHFGKRTDWRQSKIIGIKRFKLLSYYEKNNSWVSGLSVCIFVALWLSLFGCVFQGPIRLKVLWVYAWEPMRFWHLNMTL